MVDRPTTPCDRPCDFYDSNQKCSGCTYQHIARVIERSIRRLEHRQDTVSRITVAILKEIDEEAYNHGSNVSRGAGGRLSVDRVLRSCLKKRLGIELLASAHSKVKTEGHEISIKHDGHFRIREKDIFIEYKGYPEEGQILASMTASQLLKKSYKGARFYLIVHNSEQLKERMPRANQLLEAYPTIDGVFGLDCLEDFIRLIMEVL